MKKIILPLVLSLITIYSCNQDDDQILIQENTNGFFINSEFKKVNKGYYTPDLSTEQGDDFLIILTDGEIVSFLTDSNEFEFSITSTNSVVFRGIQNPNNQNIAANFVPSDSYEFNSSNASFSYASFEFDCESTNGVLQACQYLTQIEDSTIPNIAVIDIEFDGPNSNYIISYNIELSDGVNINGQFNGDLEHLQ